MNTSHIYERIMLTYSFNKMKNLRNQWDWGGVRDNPLPGIASLVDIGGPNSREYESILHSSDSIVFEMLSKVIQALIKEYNIPVKYYDLRTSEAALYYVGEKKLFQNHVDYHIVKDILAFSRTDHNQDILYVFKKYGIHERVPKKTIEELLKAANLKRYCYISYVESDAFSEIINHNKDENDPTRGTGIFSFKQFIEGFFGAEEYSSFKSYASQFAVKAKDYLGFSLIRTLKRNAIPVFKRSVFKKLETVSAEEIGASGNIENTQREIIEESFITKRNFEVLLGHSDFAKSFITAEWLYSSLSTAGNIDFTAVAMGYFKSIEQLLFQFLKLHTHEKDGHGRKIFVGKGKMYADINGYALLTDSLVNDEEKVKDITLGALTGFFGYYDPRTGYYHKRNQDLLDPRIDENTYEYIIRSFCEISGLRNGYFHKENLEDWDKVTIAMNSALLVYYLLLGAYSFSEDEKTQLGLIRVDEHDDYYNLCNYINRKAYDHEPLVFPVFYADDISDPYAFAFPYQDDFVEYDNYGEPIFSGVFFKEYGKDGRIIKLTRDHLPNEIWEGSFIISESIPITMKPTGAEKLIFKDGKFVSDT